jgi:hypothetical protein
MKLNYFGILFLLLLFSNVNTNAQAPSIEWQKSLGGTSYDYAYSINQTTDGGYIVAGYSSSNNGYVTGNHGNADYLVVKLSSAGAVEWQKSLGGTSFESASFVNQTTDGGYIVAGYSGSNNGDVTGNHGVQDFWIVKLSSIGTIQWQKSLGGTQGDYGSSIVQTTDGGYIVAGYTGSNNGDVTENHGGTDYWIVKLSSTGVIQWQKSLGGIGRDYAYSIVQTTDGGYIVAGYTESNDGDVSGNHGDNDYWVVKLSSTGAIQWQKSLGGTSEDKAYSIIQTTDEGYIIAGHTVSNDGDVSGNRGSTDYWVVKLSSAGAIQWQKSLGATAYDAARSINQTIDGGYIVAGYSFSNAGDVSGNHGNADYWIAKLSPTGALQWQKSLGGTSTDIPYSINQTTDGGYIVAGYSSLNNGDITGNNGVQDFWIVKLAPDNLSNSVFAKDNINISLFPNPAKEKITLKLNFFHPSQEITINNILGKSIYNQKLDGLTTTINTSNFQKGVYFLNVLDGTKTISKKFIVE